MASEDTIEYAENEEEHANILQREIEKSQAKIEALQRDIDQESRLIADFQAKQSHHAEAAKRLRQKALEEQEHERQEQLRRDEQEKDTLAKRAAKGILRNELFR